MRQEDVPVGYSAIRTANVLGNQVVFTVKAEVLGKRVEAINNHDGVSLKVEECNFKAIAEFQGHPKLKTGLYEPKRWHIGFVQNMRQGGIVYHYQSGDGATVRLASISPENLPCKDAGGPSTWYDPNPALSLKGFGVAEEFIAELPREIVHYHPARTDPMTRYVEMGDAPGTGNLPLRLVCKSVGPHNGGVLNQEYRIGWHDPLDANPNAFGRARLSAITGNLTFKTWLALSSEANPARLRTTQLFLYLYFWEWNVNYATNINGNNAIPTGRAILVDEGACSFGNQEPTLTGPDANESVCVKFL